MHKSRLALAAALALLVLPAAVLHAAARTVEITWDTSSKILVTDCRYNVIDEYRVDGELQVSKTIYSSKGIRVIYVPIAPESGTIKKYFKTFKICAKITSDDSSEHAQTEQRFLFIAVYNDAVAYYGGVVPLAAALPLGSYIPLSSGQGCLVVDAKKLPEGKKLAAAITWDLPCDEKDQLPRRVQFSVWLEDNRVEVPDDPTPAKPSDTITVMTPKAEISLSDERVKYALAGAAAAALLGLLLVAPGRGRR
ncbi:hypothetical protein [Pyrodictium abyssi]|uniref:Uncharacterized protein n=1 Tax=Pyrodictium abyssi TaxID=54256 RepID=A0ABM8IUL2_9CREN|nr:hypothetical protein PABY_08110 [Pyrodictium abyssi]